MKSILSVARTVGILRSEIEPYGEWMAKISLGVCGRLSRRREVKYIFVTAMTPTFRGEGKTVTAIALSMALNRAGKMSVATLRQPSMGLYFARKGGGSGGGRSRLVPQEEIDFHCTGDLHAVSLAHNLAAAHIDNLLYWGNGTRLEKENVFWSRTIDICDRSLRNVITGTDSPRTSRKATFVMTAASELMSILSLSRTHDEMRRRISRITIGRDRYGKSIVIGDIRREDELARILHKALLPNLVLSAESTPVILHCGSFSNISHGNCSVLADEMGMRIAEYVVTEGGGGTDTGFEKFLSVKYPSLRVLPDAVVLVVTARALKMHGLSSLNKGRMHDECEWSRRNGAALKAGMRNLEMHIRNVKMLGFPLVVAVNKFSFDTDEEIRAIVDHARKRGADFSVVHEGWQRGSRGANLLARAVIEAAQKTFRFKKLYRTALPASEKILEVATKMYGAQGIALSPSASGTLDSLGERASRSLALCIAKTHLSLSHDPDLKNVPEAYTLPVVGFTPFTGAGYLCALTGKSDLMPGMPPPVKGRSCGDP